MEEGATNTLTCRLNLSAQVKLNTRKRRRFPNLRASTQIRLSTCRFKSLVLLKQLHCFPKNMPMPRTSLLRGRKLRGKPRADIILGDTVEGGKQTLMSDLSLQGQIADLVRVDQSRL